MTRKIAGKNKCRQLRRYWQKRKKTKYSLIKSEHFHKLISGD
jgi:hypothetical protein